MEEYRFIFDANLCGGTDPFVGEPVSSKELAEGQLNAIANYTLHLHETSLMPDLSNYGWVEQRDDNGKWVEIDEDEL